MAILHQFDYIFALGVIFAFLDAWNIGANDVANSFATSVSSRSLTLKQAMLIASVMEFSGAILVGSRVADTIRGKILNVKFFEADPAVLMLGMLCALIGSSTWLSIATKFGLPVSTTHSIIGGVIGVGFATLGADGVNWGWKTKGVSQVFAAWAIAPGIAGIFAVTIFLITKYGVLKRKDPLRAGLWMIPFYFGITSGILTMLIVWKGAPSLKLDKWSASQVLGCIFGVAGGVVLLYAIFLLPYLHRKLVQEDWTLKPWEVFYGPLLWFRGPVPPVPEGQTVEIVQDYYRSYKANHPGQHGQSTDIGSSKLNDEENPTRAEKLTDGGEPIPRDVSPQAGTLSLEKHEREQLGPWYTPRNLFIRAKYLFFRGVDRDVVSEQVQGKNSFLSGDIHAMHAAAPHYDNKAENLYSFLQILTASVSSFAHGSNDVSNAMGPLSTIYLIWRSGKLSSKSPVPVWVLAFGGASIVIGLWTYGYHIMRSLGNRLTLHSPSRGFSMELGAALTVVFATRLGLPISTTQCIVGATVAVGLATGTWRSINWRMVTFIYFGWFITLPVTALISGLIMGFVINAPIWPRTQN